jgi:hypothetical protein
MTIQLNPEQEKVIGDAIQAGMIQAADDAVEIGIASIRQRLRSQESSFAVSLATEWTTEFNAWVHGHSTLTPLLTDEAIDRESIYGSRGA